MLIHNSLILGCRFHTCSATVDDNSEERKVHKLLSRFFKEHGPAAGIDLNPIMEQLSI